jgi:hypothetical protein
MSKPNPNKSVTVSPSDRWVATFMPMRQANAAMNSNQPLVGEVAADVGADREQARSDGDQPHGLPEQCPRRITGHRRPKENAGIVLLEIGAVDVWLLAAMTLPL